MPDLLQTMFEDGFLSSTELLALRQTCKELHENPVRILRSLNIASPEEIQGYFRRFFKYGAVGDREMKALGKHFSRLMPEDLALELSVFPIGENKNVLIVGMEDPSDLATKHKLEFFLDRRVQAWSATAQQIGRAIVQIYGADADKLNLPTLLESSRGIQPKEFIETDESSPAPSRDDRHAGAASASPSSEPFRDFEGASSGENEGAASPEDFENLFGSEHSGPEVDPSVGQMLHPEEPSTLEDAINSDLASAGDLSLATDDVPLEGLDAEAVDAQGLDDLGLGGNEGDLSFAEESSGTDATSSSDLGLETENDGSLAASAEMEGEGSESAQLELSSDLDATSDDFTGLGNEELVDGLDSDEGAQELADEGLAEKLGDELVEDLSGEELSLDAVETSELELPVQNDESTMNASETDELENIELSQFEEPAAPEANTEEHNAPQLVAQGNETALPAELVSELAHAVNSVLLKLAMSSNGQNALDILNAKLAPIGANVAFLDNETFEVNFGDFKVQGKLNEDGKGQPPLVEALMPAVKRIFKLGVANF